MTKMITLTIDGRAVTVPEGTLIVEAAKQIGLDIPVFCYHPKMEPVGMCRMCLVEVGRPTVDRASGQLVRNLDGTLRVQYGAKLETACTTTVSEGMSVLIASDKARDGRKEIVEFLLTSHPLDCPVCDKGGECPLQNLTMEHGSGQSRFLFDEKMHHDKHVPLGELIFLDRERCIQCARCVRFQSDLVGEPVIGFYQRGRALEIISNSEPGFDSVFSGNTTDICPVGALTTADFRFGARPWEMHASASVCAQCAVGCNITFNTRREAKSDGRIMIKRVMPRQHEQVNEIWICDKGRFGYHYAESEDRLARPLLRKDGALKLASWDAAIKQAAEKLGAAKKSAVVLVSGRLANEDLFNLKQLADRLGGQALLYTGMGGGELTAQVGLGAGADLGKLGKGDAILVVASDLQAEAPLWWLRVQQAARRGATLIVASARATKLDGHASFVVRYAYGDEVKTVHDLGPGKNNKIAALFAKARRAVIFYGSDGLGLAGSSALANACAHLLEATRHIGKPECGLVAVWPRANDQGAWELGFRPAEDLAAAIKGKTVYLVAADPAGDDARLAKALDSARFLIVQDLFRTVSTGLADVVFPAQAYTERDGSYTSGERRVQRFFQAVPSHGEARADYAIAAQIGARLGLELEGRNPAAIFERIAAAVPAFAGLSYARLAETVRQTPVVGRGDLYYGGTTYENTQGLGAHLALPKKVKLPAAKKVVALRPKEEELLAVPVTRLYDHGTTVYPSALLRGRIGKPFIALHPDTAARLGRHAGEKLKLKDVAAEPVIRLDESISTGVALLPRSMGLPLSEPTVIHLPAVRRGAKG